MRTNLKNVCTGDSSDICGVNLKDFTDNLYFCRSF